MVLKHNHISRKGSHLTSKGRKLYSIMLKPKIRKVANAVAKDKGQTFSAFTEDAIRDALKRYHKFLRQEAEEMSFMDDLYNNAKLNNAISDDPDPSKLESSDNPQSQVNATS